MELLETPKDVIQPPSKASCSLGEDAVNAEGSVNAPPKSSTAFSIIVSEKKFAFCEIYASIAMQTVCKIIDTD